MKLHKLLLALALAASLGLTACTENYANGERVGMITRFSQKGLIFNSWEGTLNTTQTGMNSAEPFEFSVDNDFNDPRVIATIDSAATEGWKIKIKYHEVMGKNWLNNRGESNHFVKEVEVLDRNPMGAFKSHETTTTPGRVDTIYVVIYRDK